MLTDDLSVFESWVDLNIILTAMCLVFGCTNAQTILYCVFIALVIVKTIIDIVRMGKNAKR